MSRREPPVHLLAPGKTKKCLESIRCGKEVSSQKDWTRDPKSVTCQDCIHGRMPVKKPKRVKEHA